MPDGKTRPTSIEMDEDTEEKALALIKLGCHFDVEMLSTGLISMTCEKDDEEDELIAIELCENNPNVITATRKLVLDSYNQLINKGENCNE
jgi:hypothetical protein